MKTALIAIKSNDEIKVLSDVGLFILIFALSGYKESPSELIL